MDIRTLRLFVEIANQGSFTDAAKVVFTTPSTVSKTIKNLEDELGVRLVERSGRGKGLTHAGETLYQRAINVLAEMQGLEDDLAQLQGLLRGSLRIGLPISGADILHASLYAHFRQRHPGVEVLTSVENSPRLLERLRVGDIDLALVLAQPPQGVETQLIHSDALVMAVPASPSPTGLIKVPLAPSITASAPIPTPAMTAGTSPQVFSPAPLPGLELSGRSSHWAAGLGREHPRDLPLILYEQGALLNDALLQRCQQMGLAHRNLPSSGQMDFMLELVAANLGMAFFPKRWTERHVHPHVRYQPVPELALHWQVSLAWRHGASLSPAAQAWLALAKEQPFAHLSPSIPPLPHAP